MAQPHPDDVSVPVPYRSKMLNELQPGQTLTVQGVVNPGCERFSVNLLAGSADLNAHMGSVPLHVNVRFDEGKIVLNSYQGGQWAEEERVKNPFKVGEPFDLRIRAHDDKYEISADQKEVTEFKYRFPLKTVDHISVEGGVSLKSVHWGGRYFQLPYTTQFPGGQLAAGQRLYVYGIPKGDRFEVDLLNRAGDAAFHFNPRFGEKQVVRNAQTQGAWGNEEREGTFPFKKEIGFDLVIANETYSIQVFVNGERFGTFAHRGDPSDIVALRIAGDLELTGIEVS